MNFGQKIIVIAVIIILILVIAVIFFIKSQSFQNQPAYDILGISQEEIVNLLKENKDSLVYIEKYPDFKIEKKTVLTRENILEGQNAKNFKEVYQDLDLEDNRYIQVELINKAGDRGLIAVLDFKKKEVINVFGLILLKAGLGVQGSNRIRLRSQKMS